MGIKSKFCAKCGKETGKLLDGVCIDCSFSDLEVRLPKKITLVKCKHCGAVNFEGIWIEADQPDEFYFENMLIKKMRLPEGAELEEIKVHKAGETEKIEATISHLGKKFTRYFEIKPETLIQLCESCSARKREHYEAKIQLRTYNKEELAKMMKLMQEFRTHILKIEDQPSGVDIFLASKEAARHLAAELRKDFDLKTKQSGDQYGWDKFKNKPKYRLVILMRERD